METSNRVPGFILRTTAFLIDVAIVFLAGSLITWPLSDYFATHMRVPKIVLLIFCLIYFAIFDGNVLKMASPGKILLGLRITSLRPLSPWRAMLRKAFVLLPFYPGAVAAMTSTWPEWLELGTKSISLTLLTASAIGIFPLIALSKNKRGIHDYLLRTRVLFKGQNDADGFPKVPFVVKTFLISFSLVPAILLLVFRQSIKTPEMEALRVTINGVYAEMKDMGFQKSSLTMRTYSLMKVFDISAPRYLAVEIFVPDKDYTADYKNSIDQNVIPLLREKFSNQRINVQVYKAHYWGLLDVGGNELIYDSHAEVARPAL